MTRKTGSWALIVLLSALSGFIPARAGGQDQIEKPKIFRESYPIVTDADYFCSFFVVAAEPPTRIEAPDSADGKILLSDGDLVWVRGAAGEVVRPGQVFAVVAMQVLPPGSKKPAGPGPIGFRRGRLRVVRTDGERFLAKIEKACGIIRVGDGLLPFEDKAPIMGKNLGFETLFQGGEVLTGRLINFGNELNQIGLGDWALIDIGADQGLKVGQQLTAYTKPEGVRPARAAANVVVVDVGKSTATVKVLSAADALRLGDLVQIK